MLVIPACTRRNRVVTQPEFLQLVNVGVDLNLVVPEFNTWDSSTLSPRSLGDAPLKEGDSDCCRFDFPDLRKVFLLLPYSF